MTIALGISTMLIVADFTTLKALLQMPLAAFVAVEPVKMTFPLLMQLVMIVHGTQIPASVMDNGTLILSMLYLLAAIVRSALKNSNMHGLSVHPKMNSVNANQISFMEPLPMVSQI